MPTAAEKKFIKLAHEFYRFTKDEKWSDKQVDKEPLWQETENFIKQIDKARISPNLKYRSYGFVLSLIHYYADGKKNNLACDLLAKRASTSPKNNDIELQRMTIMACQYGRYASPMAKEKALFHIYQKLENKQNFYYTREVYAYKTYNKQQKRMVNLQKAEQNIQAINKMLQDEPSPEKRLDLLEEKIKQYTAAAFGKVNSLRKRAEVCSEALELCQKELPLRTDLRIQYTKRRREYTRNAENSLLYAQGNPTAGRMEYMKKYSGISY